VTGRRGWALIAVFVILWDALAPETLSEAFARCEHSHPALLSALWGILTAHLMGWLPVRLDPFHLALNGIHGVTHRGQHVY